MPATIKGPRDFRKSGSALVGNGLWRPVCGLRLKDKKKKEYLQEISGKDNLTF